MPPSDETNVTENIELFGCWCVKVTNNNEIRLKNPILYYYDVIILLSVHCLSAVLNSEAKVGKSCQLWLKFTKAS